jgi:inner membrane protein
MKKSLFWKGLTLVGLLLVLLMVLSIIGGTIRERKEVQLTAMASVASSWTREQTLVMPVLVVPYQKVVEEKILDKASETYRIKEKITHHLHYVALESVYVSVHLTSQSLRRGIFNVPVYQADIELKGKLSRVKLEQLMAEPNVRIAEPPVLAVGVSDQRGFASNPVVTLGNIAFEVLPGSGMAFNPNGFRVVLNSNLSDDLVMIRFGLKGMTGFHILPSAKFTQVNISSNWPHPSFGGAFLPDEREVSQKGYQARWSTSYFSTAIEQRLNECESSQCDALKELSFGVSHIEPVDHYLKSERSIKYGVLIIVLTFSCFLLFEVVKNLPLHAMHYLLVGLALAMFYLLLVAFSEHLNFLVSYSVSALACSLLIWSYMVYQIGKHQAMSLLIGLLILYWLLYMIILSEDFAFMAGALLCFICLAAIMLITRKVNWHNGQVSIC